MYDFKAIECNIRPHFFSKSDQNFIYMYVNVNIKKTELFQKIKNKLKGYTRPL